MREDKNDDKTFILKGRKIKRTRKVANCFLKYLEKGRKERERSIEHRKEECGENMSCSYLIYNILDFSPIKEPQLRLWMKAFIVSQFFKLETRACLEYQISSCVSEKESDSGGYHVLRVKKCVWNLVSRDTFLLPRKHIDLLRRVIVRVKLLSGCGRNAAVSVTDSHDSCLCLVCHILYWLLLLSQF